MAELKYQTGFLNHFETESETGALPVGANNPQKPPMGLYAEQLSGTSFLMPRHQNLKTWMYRILPSVAHGSFVKCSYQNWLSPPWMEAPTPDQLRWDPWPIPTAATDFLSGVHTICGNGSAISHNGSAVHVFAFNKDMGERYFCNADGDLLFVPQQSGIRVLTELGMMTVDPGEIAVVPRGIKMQIEPLSEHARGYMLENFGAHFVLPDRGPIGANGLANERDFQTPVAWYEDKTVDGRLVHKFCGHFWEADIQASPFDVVGWHGNYAPYKYDLSRFNTINTVSFDHPDPSIFTVLSSPSPVLGVSNVDFVIFPPRWMVAERTFRPPYYHRNVMSEYMGLIRGVYDAKPSGGFIPGGGSLHNCMTAHGPDADAFVNASEEDLKPTYIADTLAFMFESAMVYSPASQAMGASLQKDYQACWRGLKRQFRK